jgi:hypothetical protein
MRGTFPELAAGLTLVLSLGCTGSLTGASASGGSSAGGTASGPTGAAGDTAIARSVGGAGGHGGPGGAGGAAGGHGGQGGLAGYTGSGIAGMVVASGFTCAELEAQYAAAIPAAKACTPGAANQCQTVGGLTLGICAGCWGYLNDVTALNAIYAKWTAQWCNVSTGGLTCPPTSCNNGSPQVCSPTDGAAPGGVCTDMFPN